MAWERGSDLSLGPPALAVDAAWGGRNYTQLGKDSLSHLRHLWYLCLYYKLIPTYKSLVSPEGRERQTKMGFYLLSF